MEDSFGTDVDTFPDLDGTGRMISGPRVIMVMALRRLTTPYGSLRYDPDFGLDLREYLNEDLDAVALLMLQSRIVMEVSKDERVLRCTARVTLLDDVLRIRIGIATEQGPFEFTLSISDVTAQILQET